MSHRDIQQLDTGHLDVDEEDNYDQATLEWFEQGLSPGQSRNSPT